MSRRHIRVSKRRISEKMPQRLSITRICIVLRIVLPDPLSIARTNSLGVFGGGFEVGAMAAVLVHEAEDLAAGYALGSGRVD